MAEAVAAVPVPTALYSDLLWDKISPSNKLNIKCQTLVSSSFVETGYRVRSGRYVVRHHQVSLPTLGEGRLATPD